MKEGDKVVLTPDNDYYNAYGINPPLLVGVLVNEKKYQFDFMVVWSDDVWSYHYTGQLIKV